MKRISMHKNKPKVAEQGIVSIVITIILMFVLTLIVLSFSAVSRREQRSATDRQLSTQAFYAAESGVNDAKKVLRTWLANGDPRLTGNYMDDCFQFATVANAGVTAGMTTLGTPLSASGVGTYTCMFVDPSVPDVQLAATDSQHVLPIQYMSGNPIDELSIFWDSGSGGTNFGGCPSVGSNPFPSSYTNCDAPILRIELVNAIDLTTSKVFFVYPRPAPGSVDYTLQSGATAQGECTVGGTPKKCVTTITNLTGTSYFMRVRGIYRAAALTIVPNTGVTEEFVGVQGIIDVTGRAGDVVRRIQVRAKANELTSNTPMFGLEGTDVICKKYTIDGTGAIDDGSCWGGGGPN